MLLHFPWKVIEVGGTNGKYFYVVNSKNEIVIQRIDDKKLAEFVVTAANQTKSFNLGVLK